MSNVPSKHKAQRNHGITARLPGKLARSPMWQPFYRYLKVENQKATKTTSTESNREQQ